MTLLNGAESVTRGATEDAFPNYVAWLVPTDCRLALPLTAGVLNVAVMPLPDADISLPLTERGLGCMAAPGPRIFLPSRTGLSRTDHLGCG